jgi:cytochrome c-type biogenesis protein CcmE
MPLSGILLKEGKMENVMTPRTTAGASTALPRKHAWKFLIGGVLILATIAFVMMASFQSNSVYYLTLSEFNTQRAGLVGQTVRINGPLDKASIQFDQENLILKFNLKDGDVVLPVVYKGVVPDTMGKGESVVAEGRLDASGIFRADNILVKCPSKYEEQGTSQSGSQ